MKPKLYFFINSHVYYMYIYSIYFYVRKVFEAYLGILRGKKGLTSQVRLLSKGRQIERCSG